MRAWGWACVLASVGWVAHAKTPIVQPVVLTGDTAQDLQRALLAARPVMWLRVAQLPRDAQAYLTTLTPMSIDRPMAEPGQPYNTTDARAPEWPNARFVIGGRTDVLGFVVYDIGGFVPTQQLAVFALDRPPAQLSCVYALQVWARDWRTLKAVLQRGQAKAIGPCVPARVPRSE